MISSGTESALTGMFIRTLHPNINSAGPLVFPSRCMLHHASNVNSGSLAVLFAFFMFLTVYLVLSTTPLVGGYVGLEQVFFVQHSE